MGSCLIRNLLVLEEGLSPPANISLFVSLSRLIELKARHEGIESSSTQAVNAMEESITTSPFYDTQFFHNHISNLPVLNQYLPQYTGWNYPKV